MSERHPDALAFEYLAALDGGDLDTLERLWVEALDSPELARDLEELTEAAADELDAALGCPRVDSQRVLELARLHLPGAFPEEPEEPLPVTVADVAARLKAENAVPKGDAPINERLLSDATELPDQLGAPQLQRWTESLNLGASPSYWKAFRRIAVMLRMSRCQVGNQLAAARRAKAKKEERQ